MEVANRSNTPLKLKQNIKLTIKMCDVTKSKRSDQ